MALSMSSCRLLPQDGHPIIAAASRKNLSTVGAPKCQVQFLAKEVGYTGRIVSSTDSQSELFLEYYVEQSSFFWGCGLKEFSRVSWRGPEHGTVQKGPLVAATLSHCCEEETEEIVARGEGQTEQKGSGFVDELGKVEGETGRKQSLPSFKTEADVLLAHYIPVYVMLPLDVVNADNVFKNRDRLSINIRALKAAQVDGLMVDIWWGVVEAAGPKQYDWSAYRALFRTIQDHGLKLQVVMSFHQCGGNVGDACTIPLPSWIQEIGESNPDIFFTNREGKRNREYLSFGVDTEPVLGGRTAVQVYADFMRSFRENMADYLEVGFITEIEVGLGPAGELRYPSYPETQGWRFPGIGEFQCYDKYMLGSLTDAASSIGEITWGFSGPHDAGHYNDWPQSTGFFCNQGSFASDYGRFFLAWYSDVLLQHGDRILEAATDVFAGCTLNVAAKVAGIHWWYNSRNHAAELAAGYYNLRERDGYRPIAKMLSRHRAVLNFTCIEMKDDEQYWEARCGPESLVSQVLNAGWSEGIKVACENALPRYDRGAFEQILKNARPHGINKNAPPKQRIAGFTFLRLCHDLMVEGNWREFTRFVRRMHAGLDYHPEPERYFHPRERLRHSKPSLALRQERASSLPVAAVPLDHNYMPIASQKMAEPFFTKDAPGGGLGMKVEDYSADLTRKVGAPDPTLGFMHEGLQGQFSLNWTDSPKEFTGFEEHQNPDISNDTAGIVH